MYLYPLEVEGLDSEIQLSLVMDDKNEEVDRTQDQSGIRLVKASEIVEIRSFPQSEKSGMPPHFTMRESTPCLNL